MAIEKLNSKKSAALIFSVCMAITSLPLPAFSQDFFKEGRTVHYLVGSKLGGGYDRSARLVAPYLEKYLPGNEVAVLNRPKSSGIGALNKLASTSFSKSSSVMLFNTGLLLGQLGSKKNVKADFSQFNYVGKATSEARYLVLGSASGVKSFDDLRAFEGELKFAASTIGTASYIQAALVTDVFDLPVKLLTGFSSKESRAAMIKGEIDGILTSESNVAKLVELDAGQPILRFGKRFSELYAAVPAADTVANTADQLLVVEQIEAMATLGRVTLVSPDITPAELETLRTAYEQALTDQELVREATESGIAIDMLPGAEVQNIVNTFLEAPESFRKLLQDAYLAR